MSAGQDGRRRVWLQCTDADAERYTCSQQDPSHGIRYRIDQREVLWRVQQYQGVDRITELEKKLEQAQSTNTAYSEQIEALKAEVKRLETFQDNQVAFQEIKERFYEEVVYADNGPGVEAYREYYEEMDPTTAEALYKQVIQEVAVNNKMKDYVATYSNMDAAKAAGILGAMTDNLDLAAEILSNLPAATRGAIMGEMDPAVAARITKIMNPGS